MERIIDGFSQKQKATAFEQIAIRYYNKNFGTMSKYELETLLFSICIENLLEQHSDDPDKAISDYRLSKLLGISQIRVRNLKIRKELLFPRKAFNWRSSFAKYVQNARYDSTSNKIFINIHDPNVYIEVQQYIESFGGYIEKQINQKLLVIKPEHLLTLLIGFDESVHENDILAKINKHFKNEKDINRQITKENMPDVLKVEGIKVALEAIALLPGGSLIKQLAQSIETIIDHS